MTQEALAAQIGTSQSNVSEIEKGKHNPTMDTLQRVAVALHVDISELFEPSSRDEAFRRFLSAYDRLSAEERVKIVELAELMAARAPNP